MRVSARKGDQRGQAVIEVQDLYFNGPPEDVRFAIQQDNVRYLGVGEWQVSETKLAADRVEPFPQGLRLHVGPSVVDVLERGKYQFKLYLPGGQGLDCGLVWPLIAPSPNKAVRQERQVPDDGRAKAQAPSGTPPPPTPTLPPPLATLVGPTPSSTPPPPPSPPVPGPEIPPLDPALEQAIVKKKRWPRVAGLFLALFLAAILAAAGVIWMGDGNLSFFSTPLEQARGALRQNVPAPEAVALATKLRRDPAGVDGAFLLLQYAAEGGQAQAAWQVGQYYDPFFEGPRGSIIPNPAKAHEWYDKALKQGETQALASLEKLREGLKQRASQGDAEAVEALRDWR